VLRLEQPSPDSSAAPSSSARTSLDGRTSEIVVKVVNSEAVAKPVRLAVEGAATRGDTRMVVLASADPPWRRPQAALMAAHIAAVFDAIPRAVRHPIPAMVTVATRAIVRFDRPVVTLCSPRGSMATRLRNIQRVFTADDRVRRCGN